MHRTVRIGRAALVALALIVLAACGGAPVDTSQGTPPGSPTPTATASASGSRPPTAKATAKASSGAKTAKPTPRATATGGAVARLDRACGRRGVDTQGVTVTTQPNGPVGFNTQYSDGSSNVDGVHSYDGGYGGGFADESGRYRTTWVVPANAPLGIATIRMVTADGSLELTYLVVAKDGNC